MENNQSNHACPTDVANISWYHHDGSRIVRNQRQGSEQKDQGWVQDTKNARHLRPLQRNERRDLSRGRPRTLHKITRFEMVG